MQSGLVEILILLTCPFFIYSFANSSNSFCIFSGRHMACPHRYGKTPDGKQKGSSVHLWPTAPERFFHPSGK